MNEIQQFGGDYAGAVLAQLQEAAGDPNVTLEDVRERLMWLHDQAAGHDEVQVVVAEAWSKVQTLAAQAEASMDIAAAAREVARTMMEQRDAALEQHHELATALEDGDTNHPDVLDFAEALREQVEDELLYSGAFYTFCVGCDMTEDAELDVSHDEALIFHEALTAFDGIRERVTDEATAAAFRKRLADFINEFVRDLQGDDDE